MEIHLGLILPTIVQGRPMSGSQLRQQSYEEIRHLMQPGDIVAFGGNSLFSKWAKLTTRSAVTHVAVVIQTQMLEQSDERFFNQVIEATDYQGKSGVMVNRISDRLAHYDGDIWWLPLHGDARQMLDDNKKAFFDFLFAQQNKDYDIWQLFGSAVDATDNLPLLKKLSLNDPDFSSWFCSELVAAALQEAGIVKKLNASEVTPIDICRFNIFAEQYVQLKGHERHITGVNSLEPENWGYV